VIENDVTSIFKDAVRGVEIIMGSAGHDSGIRYRVLGPNRRVELGSGINPYSVKHLEILFQESPDRVDGVTERELVEILISRTHHQKLKGCDCDAVINKLIAVRESLLNL